MKNIDNGVFTSAHNLILIDKGYEFIQLFISGNNSLFNGSQINKIHIFISRSKSAYKTLQLLDGLAKKGRTKIIVHVSSLSVSKILTTYIKNNNNVVKFIFDFHKSNKEFTISDDSGSLYIYPYILIKNTGSLKYKCIMNNNKRGKTK